MSKVISGDQLTAYQRWELPSVELPPEPEPISSAPPVGETGGNARPPRPQKPQKVGATVPTLEEIEAIQEVIAKRLGYRLVDHRLELYAVPLKAEEK